MDYKHVKRPNYAIFSDDGSAKELFCKLCGSAIAGIQEMPRGIRVVKGRQIERIVERWVRFSNYCEIKIEFEDGSFHVTNGCTACLSKKLSVEVLAELHVADLVAIGGTPRQISRLPKRVVMVKPGGGIE